MAERLLKFAESLPEFAGSLALHILIALAVWLGLALFFPAVPVGFWFSPFRWGPALLVGLFANRHLRHPAACFVWVAGVIWFAHTTGLHAAGFARWFSDMTHTFRPLYFPMNWAESAEGKDSCYLFATFPALNCIAYSVGSGLGFLLPKPRPGLAGQSW